MAFILSIDTSTSVCSVAVHNEGLLLGFKEVYNSNSHSENLNSFIESLLISLNLRYEELNAIAISEGPGSYTGLRIGTSCAKGLCFALDIPLISIKTLEALAMIALDKKNNQEGLYAPMLDARRMEVYTAVYSHKRVEVKAVLPLILDENSLPKNDGRIEELLQLIIIFQ